MTSAPVTRMQLVQGEQMRHLDRAISASPWALMAAAALLLYALWDHIAHSVLLGWFASIVLLQAMRVLQSRHYRRLDPPPEQARWWLNLYTAMTLGSGCLWGLGAVLLFVPDSLPHQALLTMVLVGLVSGSVAVNTSHRPVHAAFAVPVLLPLALRTAAEGDPVHVVTAALLVVFLGFLLFTGRSVSNRVLESMQMRYENMELIEQLRRQKLAAELAQRAAEEANQAKSRFLAAASHDLRQPLHALGLFTGVLEQAVQRSEARPVLQSMRASVDALESLFNELLDISKLDAGVIAPNISSFALQPVFERVRNDFAPLAAASGLTLRVVPTQLASLGDALLLERIVRNLVANAIRYTPSGRVLLGCRRGSEHIRIEVIDTGIGIPEAERSRIFEEFYQIGNPERDRGKGLGLGLAIVKRLAGLLGYTLRVDSVVGKGSRFSVSIPRVMHATAEQLAASAPAGTHALADHFVVVVDDDASAREGLRALLRGWRCRVLAGADLHEIEQALQSRGERPDIIVSDYRLRDNMNGVALIETLRKRYAEALPAIVLTGDIRHAQTHASEAHAIEWMQKPATPERLRDTFARLLRLETKQS